MRILTRTTFPNELAATDQKLDRRLMSIIKHDFTKWKGISNFIYMSCAFQAQVGIQLRQRRDNHQPP